MCVEWLRSDLAPKHLKLKYQLLRTGGNFPNIDIYGVTFEGNELAAQVSYTSDKKTIEKKEQQLLKTKIKTKLIFSDSDSETELTVESISIRLMMG